MLVSLVLFAFLAAIALVIIRQHDLFAAVMLLGIFSLLSAGLFTAMDAVDVAFTEAAVGAGVSTLLMLGTLALTKSEEKPEYNRLKVLPLVMVVLAGAVLAYGTVDLPEFGDPEAPIHLAPVAQEYIHRSPEKMGIPNMVTSVLASYRSYDTFGEITVVFTAAVGVMLMIGWRLPRRPATLEDDEA